MDYSGLKEKLNRAHAWPSVYMFKFIVPDEPDKLAKVQSLFPDDADVSYKKSRKGNFISVTGKEMMLSAEEVIRKYKQAENIKDIIAL